VLGKGTLWGKVIQPLSGKSLQKNVAEGTGGNVEPYHRKSGEGVWGGEDSRRADADFPGEIQKPA